MAAVDNDSRVMGGMVNLYELSKNPKTKGMYLLCCIYENRPGFVRDGTVMHFKQGATHNCCVRNDYSTSALTTAFQLHGPHKFGQDGWEMNVKSKRLVYCDENRGIVENTEVPTSQGTVKWDPQYTIPHGDMVLCYFKVDGLRSHQLKNDCGACYFFSIEVTMSLTNRQEGVSIPSVVLHTPPIHTMAFPDKVIKQFHNPHNGGKRKAKKDAPSSSANLPPPPPPPFPPPPLTLGAKATPTFADDSLPPSPPDSPMLSSIMASSQTNSPVPNILSPEFSGDENQNQDTTRPSVDCGDSPNSMTDPNGKRRAQSLSSPPSKRLCDMREREQWCEWLQTTPQEQQVDALMQLTTAFALFHDAMPFAREPAGASFV